MNALVSPHTRKLRPISAKSDRTPDSRLSILAMICLMACTAFLGTGCRHATPVAITQPLPGDYLVIDISDGPSAITYPHRYSSKGPDLSQEQCRTTELWLRRIPAGTFVMGSPSNELGRYGDERQHPVTLTSHFYLGVFEVTQAQWELVTGETPSDFPGKNHPVDSVSREMIRGDRSEITCAWPWRTPRVDSTSFLGILRDKTGLMLELPTEAQWEYACRAGKATALNSGKNLTAATDKCANLDQVGQDCKTLNVNVKDFTPFSPAGHYAPNAWGLYDMHRNVAEWCLDWYQENPDLSRPAIDPQGPLCGWRKILRGGSAGMNPRDCRSATRDCYWPTSYYYNYPFGFRIAALPLN